MENQDNQTIYLLLIIGTEAMLLIAIGIILFAVVYQKRMIGVNEEKQKLVLKHQRNLNESMIRTTEQERRRIAADLHDEVGHALLTLRLQLYQDTQPEKHRQLIDETLQTVRRISYDLYPPGLETLGLENVLADIFDTVRKNIHVETDIRPFPDRHSPETEVAVFRITKELISNSVRYSGADTITFALYPENNDLVVEFTDNGSGFDAENVQKGAGLLSIENRVQAQGGFSEFKSAAGNGFYFRARFPFTVPVTEQIKTA